MEKEKFVVKVKKNYGETSVVSARLPMEIVKKLDHAANNTGRTRNELIFFMYRIRLNEIRGRGIIYFSASFFVFVNLIKKYFSKLFSNFPIIYALKVNFFQSCPYRNTSEGLHFIKTDQICSSFCVHLQYRPFSENRMLNPIS